MREKKESQVNRPSFISQSRMTFRACGLHKVQEQLQYMSCFDPMDLKLILDCTTLPWIKIHWVITPNWFSILPRVKKVIRELCFFLVVIINRR